MKGRYGAGFKPRPLKRKEIGPIVKAAREWGRKHPDACTGWRRPKS